MKKSVWLSYDLGVKGDYPSLYRWLDNHEAKECGDSVAHFQVDVPDASGDVAEQVTLDLKQNVVFNHSDRVYITWKKEDGGITGKFIIGKRKAAQWKGYGDSPDEADDE